MSAPIPPPEPKPGTPEELQMHIFSAYWNLRYGMAIVSFALPLLVFAVAYYLGGGVGLQDSMSDYYWAPRQDGVRPPSRDFFVGGLFALAVFFYLYKGFSPKENLALNIAAVFALGVAIFPMAEKDLPDASKVSLHGFCAVTMFLVLVYVIWFRADETLKFVPPDAWPSAKAYLLAYRIIGVVMVVSPLIAFVTSLWVRRASFVFFVEAAGIWAFAAFWALKSWELKNSSATAKAVQGKLALDPATDTLREVPKARAAEAAPTVAREEISGF